MRITVFRSKTNPDLGFSITEDREKTSYDLWEDSFEGGEAYQSDWDFIDSFNTFELAMEYIITNYGEVEKIRQY